MYLIHGFIKNKNPGIESASSSYYRKQQELNNKKPNILEMKPNFLSNVK